MMTDEINDLILGVIGATAGIVVPIIISILENKKKRLIFEEIQNLSVSVLEINNGLTDKIELKHADKSVNSVFTLIANIKNSGTLSIKKDEVIVPIKITFKEKLLECVVEGVSPAGIEVDLKINLDENSVECSFNLLNPLDYFTLKFVSFEKLSTPTITSRIEGLSNINIISISDQPSSHGARYNKDNYSNEYPFMYRLKVKFQYIKHMCYRCPLCLFFFPGLILASVGFLEVLRFSYHLDRHLSFVPMLLMIMLTIIGFLMCLTGTFISIYKTMLKG